MSPEPNHPAGTRVTDGVAPPGHLHLRRVAGTRVTASVAPLGHLCYRRARPGTRVTARIARARRHRSLPAAGTRATAVLVQAAPPSRPAAEPHQPPRHRQTKAAKP